MIEEQAKQSNGAIAGIGSSIFGFVVDFILMLVYMFLFLQSRSHIRKFILRVIPQQNTATAEDAMANIQKVTQQYLTGLSLMIVCLWILYSIGFSIVGLKNAFFFAILCGLLETVPFVGNLTGNSLAVLMAVTQGGGMNMIIGILITYALIQFFQTYILEPLVVGAEVNINPLFTIIALVIGELIWGIPGMVLAIPLLAIVKIICDHIDSLKPYGYLIGSEKKKKGGFLARFKGKKKQN
jgi:predicted PurR-regulated permease PerM